MENRLVISDDETQYLGFSSFNVPLHQWMAPGSHMHFTGENPTRLFQVEIEYCDLLKSSLELWRKKDCLLLVSAKKQTGRLRSIERFYSVGAEEDLYKFN